MKFTFVGDAHGKMDALMRCLPVDGRVVQLGDMGFGFVPIPHFPTNFAFIRGNHDDPALARKHPAYLGDYGYLSEHRLFYLSGAFSIDQAWRVPGQSWWADEELSTHELNVAYNLFVATKPEVVISHDCPASVALKLLGKRTGPYFEAKGQCQTSQTCQMLETMFQAHQPRYWFFGHYHVTERFEYKQMIFQCLAKLDVATEELLDKKGG